MILDQTATIATIPAGNDLEARQTVIADHPCSAAWPAPTEEIELANLATTVQAYLVLVAPNDLIKTGQRFITPAGQDLSIANVKRWPMATPRFLQLTIHEGDL